MKTVKYFFLMLLMVVVGMSAKAQQRNVLQIPDVASHIGNVQLPIHIENTDEIVGTQFDLTLPDGITVGTVGTLANRSDGHTVTISRLSSGRFRVLLHSGANRPLRGQSGVVMYLPVIIPDSFEEGSEHQITISNAVLGRASGENVLTEAVAGKIRISKLPDLTVKNITADKLTLSPGDRLVGSWQVENIGGLATGGGWSEQVSLVSEDGIHSKLLATTHYDGTINAGGIVSRQVEISLPTLLSLDGRAHLQVRIVPDSDAGESASTQVNNTQASANTLTVSKLLSLELSPKRIDENSSQRIALRVNRSGRWTVAETFTITATADSRVSVPSSITIPANQSGAVAYISITDNETLDENNILTITAQGNSYPDATGTLTIEDNEYPDLTLTTSKSALTEGETFQLTVTTNRVSAQPIEVTISSENTKRFSFLQTVTIAAGETSATIDVTAIDDELPSLELSNAFTASAPNHNKAEAIVLLKDNDLPVLELTLTPNKVQESAGVVAVAGVLRRTTNTNSKITVKLTDDADSGLYFSNRTLVLDKGVEEVHFNFGPVDNAIVDGDRTYTITAAVWLSSCSCNASGASAGYVEAQLQVLDNDGAALNVTSSLSTVKEGGKTTLTVERNTTDTSKSLTVTINSDYDEGLTYNHTVTIPAGQQGTTVEVTSSANSVQGDSHTVIFTVEAEGYAKGTCYVIVTDQTLPDAHISCITAVSVLDGSPVESLEVGDRVKLAITVNNDGAAELPAEAPVKIYLRGSSTAVGTVYTSDVIAVGNSQTVIKTITLPTTVGTHSYYAVVNESNTVQELTYNNNMSEDVTITTVSPFAIIVSTDKTAYKQGDKVTITGQLTGNSIAETDIDVYLINDGARQVQSVTTDVNGQFTYEWKLYALQSGHFTVGACYPGEGLNTEMATFDVYGLQRSSSGYITCEVGKGDTMTGQVGFKNPGILKLSNVKAEVLSKPDNCEASVLIPSTISGGSNVQMSYSLKGTEVSTERKWYEVVVRVTADEGVTQDVTLYFYCYSQSAQLVTDTKRLNTTITKGTTRDYPLQIVNTGKGESGNITLALPEFMTCESGTTIPSICQNDTITLVLRVKTNNKMQLNVPVTGTIGVNCTNGNGLTIDYSIEMVSEDKGTLQVDVCDEYTYNTAEAPHVANAEVVVRHPSTNVELARGTTNADGIFSVELPAGYYKVSVSADKHEQYTNYCSVNPGAAETLVVNISYQPITIQWNVEETEVEDVYEIVTTVQYETNVPKPVVKVTLPKSIDGDNMAVGDKVIVNMLLTNIGLVNAEEVELDLPTNMTEWKFEALAYTEPFFLAPQQTVVVPVKITRISKGLQSDSQMRKAARNLKDDFNNCIAGLGSWYKNRCGKDLKTNHAAERLVMKACAYSATMQTISNALGGFFGGGGPSGPGGGSPNGGGGGGGSEAHYGEFTKSFDICDPCDAERAERVINTLTGKSPLALLDKAIQAAIEEYQRGGNGGVKFVVRNIWSDIKEKGRDAIIEILAKGWTGLWNFVIDVIEITKPCEDNGNSENSESRSLERLPRKSKSNNWVEDFSSISDKFVKQVEAMDSVLYNVFGDRIWYNEIDDEKIDFLTYMCDLPIDSIPSDEELMLHKPSSVTTEQMFAYVKYVNGITESHLTEEKMSNLFDFIKNNHDDAFNKGFSSMPDLFFDSYDKYVKHFEDMKVSSVCASITLQIKQTMTLTRQAFRGSLIVFNGHESLPMENVKLNLEVINPKTGQIATVHEFQINAESLDGFMGQLDLGSGWTLDANSTGTATILFIPTKYAAPTESAEWAFGGTLSYMDPFTGLEVTRELYPVTLTVKPSPELDLMYFMQRDIYGDDALTLDVVEPMVPAEFALLINNIGNGDATNVRMVTNQPEIIENEKGLAINFEILSAQLNGGDKTMALGGSVATDFGTIPAHSQAYAQWWLQSSLLGHFTDYDVKATHVTSYGNPDLSLLNDITIHELIRSIKVGDGSITGFVTNDLPDAEDLPDMVYFTDGTTTDVVIATNAVWQKQSSTEYLLTITPSRVGWNYGHVNDPTFGYSKLTGIRRQSDGKEINLRNFWQTDRTLLDGKDWLYEYRLHFIDDFASGGAQTYVLTFDPVPEKVLEVTAISTVPAEGEIAEEPIEKLTVDFNKEIDATTFTGDDITFSVQGVKKNANQIVISTEDNKTFTLDMTAMNDTLPNGYYTMTVQTTDITDAEGFKGKTGKQVGWIMYRGGLVQLLTSVYPETSGRIQREGTGNAKALRAPAVGNQEATAEYGSTVTLRATPAEGYDFVNWTLNGEVVGTSPELNAQALSDMNIVANFTKKSYLVEVEAENGTIEGVGKGYYQYGEELTFTALPDADYIFTGWTVNGKDAGFDMTLTLTLDKALDIKANFARDIYHQQLTLQRGWNWVSSYISEAWPIDDMSNHSNRIVGQFDELINDPQFGLVGGLEQLTAGVAYKVEASDRFTTNFRGHLLPSSTNLKKGWNWIPYPWTEAIAVGTAITNAEDGDYLVSQHGFTEYADGYWEGTLNKLTPGEGYLYKSISNKQLCYDFTNVQYESHAKMFSAPAVTNEEVDVHRYPNTMNITARLYKDDEELTGSHYLVYAMANNELRGISEYIGNNYYITVYGYEPVDITFICESTETGSSYVANETLQFRDDVIGSRKSPFAITFGNTTGIELWNSDKNPMTVYTLKGILVGRNMTLKMLQKLPKGVYIINGQKCFVK